jgi:stress-induced-phosphoprotein 1
MAGQLFGPQMWDVLRANPETAALLSDASFRAVLDEIRADPARLGDHAGDPRVMKVFATLATAASAAMPPAGAAAPPRASSTATPATAATGSSSSNADKTRAAAHEEMDNLDHLPEKERTAALALREKEKGNAAYKARDFPTAIALYTKAFQMHPQNVALLTNRAAAKFEAGDYDGTIADCREAITLNHDNSLRTDFKVIARAWARMANAYMKLEKLDEAVEAYQKSLTEFHDDKVYAAHKAAIKARELKESRAYINPDISAQERAEGNKLFKEGDFPASIKKYTEAIKRNPDDAVPYSNRAASYMKLGEFPMALRDCDRCLELDSKFIKAYARKGKIHFFMKEYHKCLEVYQKGLQVDPTSAEMRQGLLETKMKIQEQQSSGEVDEEQVKHAMADPEIQGILNDPEVQSMLKRMEQEPSAAARIMQSDPVFASKVEKLMAAGVIRVQ